jgi:hypothetical protein
MVAHDLGRGLGRPGEQWRAFASRMASYSADIAADLISEPSTGTNLDIAATDQIRPIATTMAIAMDVLRMCIPLCLRRAWRNRGSHICGRPNVRQFTDAQSFLKHEPGKAKIMAMTGCWLIGDRAMLPS